MKNMCFIRNLQKQKLLKSQDLAEKVTRTFCRRYQILELLQFLKIIALNLLIINVVDYIDEEIYCIGLDVRVFGLVPSNTRLVLSNILKCVIF